MKTAKSKSLKSRLKSCSEFGYIGLEDKEFHPDTVMASKTVCPANTTISYKSTSYGSQRLVRLRFDRKTIPKSGKSVYKTVWIEKKKYGYLIWDRQTRALLGTAKEHNLFEKADEYIRRFTDDKDKNTNTVYASKVATA